MAGGSGTTRARRRVRLCRWLVAPALAASTAILPAQAQTTPETIAGTVITNVATLRTGIDGQQVDTVSNEVRLVVAERLDVTLTSPSTGSTPTPITVGAGPVAVPVILTNGGNGQEAFTIAARGSDASVTIRAIAIAIDTDGDGVFDPARDTLLVDGRTPSLAPGGSLALLVLLDAATPVTATGLTVTARADTGSGTPGTGFPGRGDGGGDALAGATGAMAILSLPIAPADPTAPSLVKRQSVRAPDGTANPLRGATITYVLEARFPATTAGARLSDPIPAGTRYVAGSLRLDAASLSDAADTDPGRADAEGIDVALGDIAGSATRPVVRTVQFQVTIQ